MPPELLRVASYLVSMLQVSASQNSLLKTQCLSVPSQHSPGPTSPALHPNPCGPASHQPGTALTSGLQMLLPRLIVAHLLELTIWPHGAPNVHPPSHLHAASHPTPGCFLTSLSIWKNALGFKTSPGLLSLTPQRQAAAFPPLCSLSTSSYPPWGALSH